MKDDLVRRNKCKNFCDSLDAEDSQKHDRDSKGRILRIKHGYNPNSSSMGSIVFALPTAIFGVMAGFGVVSAIILSAFIKDTNRNDSEKEHLSDKRHHVEDSDRSKESG